jgi:hypothetical protein
MDLTPRGESKWRVEGTDRMTFKALVSVGV